MKFDWNVKEWKEIMFQMSRFDDPNEWMLPSLWYATTWSQSRTFDVAQMNKDLLSSYLRSLCRPFDRHDPYKYWPRSMLLNFRKKIDCWLVNYGLVGWLVGFNVWLLQRSGQLPTAWDSSPRMVRRHAITLLIRHGRGGSSALAPSRGIILGRNLEDTAPFYGF